MVLLNRSYRLSSSIYKQVQRNAILKCFSSMTNAEIVEYDRKHVFHPYTSMTHPLDAYVVNSAKGVYLNLDDGIEVIDGMSSWWAMVHGYRNPVLDNALKSQIDQMSHVMFGGLTHEPAVKLVKKLVEISPNGLDKVFLCDSGSVSVEVAIKMAIQYWYRMEKPEKSKLLTIRSGYHGDTFGAMSVCDPVTGMHEMFSKVLAKNHFADSPKCDYTKVSSASSKCSNRACPCASSLAKKLRLYHDEICAVILEPIVQGTGGMKVYPPKFLQEVRDLCDKYDVLLIADEIATGFGRTGEMFACDHAKITPDIMCIGKTMTGGYMTLGATISTEKVAHGVSANGGVFMHGPTYMGNPLACAVANASIELLMDSDWKERVSFVEKVLQSELKPLLESPVVADVRTFGAIGVCELKEPLQSIANVQKELVKCGVWLRPFGKLLYTMPPFNSPDFKEDHLVQIVNGIKAVVKKIEQGEIK